MGLPEDHREHVTTLLEQLIEVLRQQAAAAGIDDDSMEYHVEITCLSCGISLSLQGFDSDELYDSLMAHQGVCPMKKEE